MKMGNTDIIGGMPL